MHNRPRPHLVVTEFLHLALGGRAPEPSERVFVFDGVPEESHGHR